MVRFAYFVLMAKSGMRKIELVHVLLVIFGMEIVVKGLFNAQDIEFGISYINNASVQITIFGMGLHV